MTADGDATPKKRRVNYSAMEIAQQVNTVRDWLSHGKRPHQIRRMCADEWGLSYRTAESRIAMARREALKDLDQLDRKELAAQAIETLMKVQEQSLDTRQGSNAIGATRLMLELAGILGRSA
jgi:hypothetical protein